MDANANANVPQQQKQQKQYDAKQRTQQWIEQQKALLMRGDHQDQQQSGEIALMRVQPQTNMQDWTKLNLLCMCEQRQKANWDAWTEIPAWMFKIKSLEQLLHCSSNFLTKHNESVDCRRLKMVGSEEEFIDLSWVSTPAATNAICIDVLLLLEWATQMPVFARLETADQLILLMHIYQPFVALLNAFYSKQANAETWTRANVNVFPHYCPTAIGPFWNDERFRFLCKQYFCGGVEALAKMDIGREAFALLLSIICCNSNAAGLSAAGRELLYNQSADYSRILMIFLQQRNAHESGAKKFLDCMRLLELMFQMPRRYQQFVVYRDMCKIMRSMGSANQIKCPKAISMFSPYRQN